MFFVDGRCHRRGIGRKLFEKALEENDKDYFIFIGQKCVDADDYFIYDFFDETGF